MIVHVEFSYIVIMSDARLSAAYFAFLTSAAAASLYFLKCKRVPPRWWVRPWADSRRGTLAMAHNEMRNEDVESFTRASNDLTIGRYKH